MTFLPVVERELRVAARKRSTTWSRVIGVLMALVIGAGFMIFSRVGPFGLSAFNLGRALFITFTWLAFAAALGMGLFLTSDSISEEKREGTLGLLFLTDLRGYDVVLGKLLATSLQGFYGLLGIIPVMAIPILMGGVTGDLFWKTVLALLHAVPVSLGAGLFVSVFSRDSEKAMAGTLGLLVVLAGGGPAIDAIIGYLSPGPGLPLFSLVSPVYLLIAVKDPWGTNFGNACLGNELVAAALFFGASMLAPRVWQDTGRRGRTAPGAWRRRWSQGGVSGRRRVELLSRNPVLWLVLRQRWQARLIWVIALVDVAAIAAISMAGGDSIALWLGSRYIAGLTSLLLYFLASQSGRFFVEARQNGVMELLLSTPLTPQAILEGRWRGWLRLCGLPILLIVLLQGITEFQSTHRTLSRMKSALARPAVPPPTVSTNGGASGTVVAQQTTTVTFSFSAGGAKMSTMAPGGASGGGEELWEILLTMAISVASMLTTLFNLAALFWFGLWTGLTTKKTTRSSLKALLFVQVIPWFAIAFASALSGPLLILSRGFSGSGSGVSFYVNYTLVTAVVSTVLYLAKDIAFCVWARRHLHAELRTRAAGEVRTAAAMPRPPVLPESDPGWNP